MRPLQWALWWVVGGAALFALILYVCLRPSSGMSPWFPQIDKLQHAGAFFVLSFWFFALVERRAYLRVTLVMIAVGAGIEVAQGVMALGRSAEWLDLLADVSGVLMALGVSWLRRDSWFAKVEAWLQPT